MSLSPAMRRATMTGWRTERLKFLHRAERNLADAVALAAKLPVAGEDDRLATVQIVELREAVARIEKLLDKPGE